MTENEPAEPEQSEEQDAAQPGPARFEEALAELEQLVENLEGGNLSLEDSLSQFERGVRLARECRDSLAAAEQKVQVLLERDGDSELADFDPEADSDDQ